MVPKILWQCGKWSEKDIPDYVESYRQTWLAVNPNWQYFYMDDAQCYKSIEEILGKEYAEIFNKIPRGDNKADFWRTIIINEHGGFYADLDTICHEPIEQWADLNKDFIVTQNHYLEIGTIWENWCFGSSKNNPLVKNIIKKVINKIDMANSEINAHHTFFPFTQTVQEFLNKPWIQTIVPSINFKVSHIAAHDNWDNSVYFRTGNIV